MAKRIFDLVFSYLGLFFSFPLWLVIIWGIKIADGGPVLYLQERVGKGGKIFRIMKFRSMVRDAEKETGAVWAKEGDPRVTPIGKILRGTAMDELPQLISIARGDMSFVGPRPERPELMREFTQEFPDFNRRLEVVPGLTGIAQIFGSAYLDFREKLKYDLWYVRNRGFFLDLLLVIISFLITFKAKWEIGSKKLIPLGKRLKQRLEKDIPAKGILT